MVKVKIKSDNLSKFLNSWDKEIYDLSEELRKINLKQKKEKLIIKKIPYFQSFYVYFLLIFYSLSLNIPDG